MAEAKQEAGGSWEDLTLPDAYPPPCTEDRAELNEKSGEKVSAAREESSQIPEVKSSPNLLQMLKAAESRWTPHGQDREDTVESKVVTEDVITEAVKTDMVSLQLIT